MSNDVLVACKLPHGIFLDVGKQRIQLNGTIQSGRVKAPFFMAPSGCVGLTKVPCDFWEAWIKDHQEFQPVKQGLIFAADKKKNLLAEAEEKKDVKHGLERLDPSSMPTMLKQVNAGDF